MEHRHGEKKESDNLELLSSRMGMIESMLSEDDLDFALSPIKKRTEIKSTIPRNLHVPSPPAIDYSSPLPKLNRPIDERHLEEKEKVTITTALDFSYPNGKTEEAITEERVVNKVVVGAAPAIKEEVIKETIVEEVVVAVSPEVNKEVIKETIVEEVVMAAAPVEEKVVKTVEITEEIKPKEEIIRKIVQEVAAPPIVQEKAVEKKIEAVVNERKEIKGPGGGGFNSSFTDTSKFAVPSTLRVEKKVKIKSIREPMVIFRWEGKALNEDPEYNAAVMIQKIHRGILARIYFHSIVDDIPHLVYLTVVRAKNLEQQAGAFGVMMNPYAQVIVNCLTRSHCKNWRVMSAGQTKVAGPSQHPEFIEDIKLIVTGPAKFIINVMSPQTLTAPLFIGQAILDLSKLPHLKPGTNTELEITLRSMKVPVYDHMGEKVTTAYDVPTGAKLGSIVVNIHIPRRLKNVCGHFYQILTNSFGTLYGEKVWGELDHSSFSFYKSPLDNKIPIESIPLNKILKIEEFVYNEMEVPYDAIRIHVDSDIIFSRLIAWCDEDSHVRGLWRHLLLSSCPRVSMEVDGSVSSKLTRKQIDEAFNPSVDLSKVGKVDTNVV